ncbi:hypothetical protein Ancab_028237 [Ancistrocladus abbreviatus]
MGHEPMDRRRSTFGIHSLTDTFTNVNFSAHPFAVSSDSTTVVADSVIIATVTVAKGFSFPGCHTFWNRRVSACTVCDGQPRFSVTNPTCASKIMQVRAMSNLKIEVEWNTVEIEAHAGKAVEGLKVKNFSWAGEGSQFGGAVFYHRE